MRERGATAIQLAVIFVPVLLGFMGFAVDLGRLYLVRGELNTAANAMALAAAQRLIGTDASTETATAATQLAVNRYDFGGVVIGEGSPAPEPLYFDTRSATNQVSGASARYVRIDLTADAPLIFWSFLSLGQSRRTPIAGRGVAGISAPLCTACGIEPIAIAPIDAGDTTDFGFIRNSRYTFGFFCTGNPTPGGLGGAPQRIPYLVLNRLNDEATLFPDESSQLFRIGASGLPPHNNPARACLTVNAAELQWANAAPIACNQNRVPELVTNFACGVATRFDATLQTGCTAIPEVDTIASAYVADTDVTNLDDYAAYTGNSRRLMTVPVVDILTPGGAMTILGFRQFIVQPEVSANDTNGRFVASYIGSVVPVRQGSFGGCRQTAGPGKVVLHE